MIGTRSSGTLASVSASFLPLPSMTTAAFLEIGPNSFVRLYSLTMFGMKNAALCQPMALDPVEMEEVGGVAGSNEGDNASIWGQFLSGRPVLLLEAVKPALRPDLPARRVRYLGSHPGLVLRV